MTGKPAAAAAEGKPSSRAYASLTRISRPVRWSMLKTPTSSFSNTRSSQSSTPPARAGIAPESGAMDTAAQAVGSSGGRLIP
jgi:hypothetical protein